MAEFLDHSRTDYRRLVQAVGFFQYLPSRPALRDMAVAHLAHKERGVQSQAVLALGSVAAEADLVATLPLLDVTYTVWLTEVLARHGGRRTAATLAAWVRAAECRGDVNGGVILWVMNVRDDLIRRFPLPLVSAAPTTDAERLQAAFVRTADDDPAARVSALQVLADLGGPDDLGPAVALLDDEDAKVREAALAAVVKAGGDRARAALDVWLRVAADRDWLDPERVERVQKARDELAGRLKKQVVGK